MISILFLTCFPILGLTLSAEDLTKKLFAGPSAPINNNYPNGRENVFRRIKPNGGPDLTGFRLDFIDLNGSIGKRNYWYLTAADVNGEPVELKGCFKYQIKNNHLMIDLYKTDQHKYQRINVKNRLFLGQDSGSIHSWITYENMVKDFNKAAVLEIPVTDDLLTKQIIFIDPKLTNLDDVLKKLAEFGAPYHLLKPEDCVVGQLRSIGKVTNLVKTYYSVLENCSFLTMRYMHRELTPHHENKVIVPPTMYNNK